MYTLYTNLPMYIVLVLFQIKKVLVLVDAIANGLWGFMWFVCFCYTADQRRRITFLGSALTNCANSGVAFSFFSIIIFVSYHLCWSTLLNQWLVYRLYTKV